MKEVPPYLRLVHSQSDEKRSVMVELRQINWPIVLVLAGCMAFHIAAITTIFHVVAAFTQDQPTKGD